MNICLFCFKAEGNTTPYCLDNPGKGCTYGFDHEFPSRVQAKVKPQPAKVPDKNICTKCGLHSRNPASATNGCEHAYPSGEV